MEKRRPCQYVWTHLKVRFESDVDLCQDLFVYLKERESVCERERDRESERERKSL